MPKWRQQWWLWRMAVQEVWGWSLYVLDANTTASHTTCTYFVLWWSMRRGSCPQQHSIFCSPCSVPITFVFLSLMFAPVRWWLGTAVLITMCCCNSVVASCWYYAVLVAMMLLLKWCLFVFVVIFLLLLALVFDWSWFCSLYDGLGCVVVFITTVTLQL